MDSIYYCFLFDAEFNFSEEWNAHVNVSFFVFCFNFFQLAHFSKETRLLLQASSEQADTESRPQLSREILPIHCQAWTCPYIVMLNYTSPAKRFLPKIVNEKKYLPTQLLTFILTKKQSDYSMVL